MSNMDRHKQMTKQNIHLLPYFSQKNEHQNSKEEEKTEPTNDDEEDKKQQQVLREVVLSFSK